MNRLEMPKNPADALVWKSEEALDLEPSTLTFMGGSRVGELGAYMYVLGVKAPDESFHLVPFALSTLDTKIADLRGGSTGIE